MVKNRSKRLSVVFSFPDSSGSSCDVKGAAICCNLYVYDPTGHIGWADISGFEVFEWGGGKHGFVLGNGFLKAFSVVGLISCA